jgi:hypothetical protein
MTKTTRIGVTVTAPTVPSTTAPTPSSTAFKRRIDNKFARLERRVAGIEPVLVLPH